MGKEKHVSKDELSKLLNKRMDEYFKAITRNGSSSLVMHVKIAQKFNIEKVINQLNSNSFFESDFWGYGINTVCDGNDSESSIDVSDFQRLPDLNKHHNKQRFLWLLYFNIVDESFFTNLFCVDTADHGVNSNLNTKYELADFKNARLRFRKNVILVDFSFNGIDKPIHFQVDTFIQGGKLGGENLARYYMSKMNEYKKNIGEKNRDETTIGSDIKVLEEKVDKIEKSLRLKFVQVLQFETGKENYLEILGGKHKNDLSRRIKQHISKHPKAKLEDYKSLNSAIDFSDIDHLKQSILKDINWEYFEPIFKDKLSVEKYFDQFSQLRHTIKHSRKLTNLVKLEGMAALDWFEQILYE